MRFFFHIILGELLYPDLDGVQCESMQSAVENARRAIFELKTEEQMALAQKGYLLIVCEEFKVAVIIPIDDDP